MFLTLGLKFLRGGRAVWLTHSRCFVRIVTVVNCMKKGSNRYIL